MSEENKCNGLDCAICAETKCPNEKIIVDGIDVSECPCKDDDKCLEVPILNEYGDLIDYQDCEPQTFCPYRSKTKIKRLQKENEGLKSLNDFNVQKIEVLKEENEKLKEKIKYCFNDMSSDYETFCDICVAKGVCNNNCCYEQLKELLYEIK